MTELGQMPGDARKRITESPPTTREPIKLTGEAEANVLVEALADPNLQEALADLLYARYGFDSFTDAYRVACRAKEVLAARLAGGPTLADAEQRGREDNADHGMCYVHGSKALAGKLADAWDEGYTNGYRLAESYLTRPDGTHVLPTNPYRTPESEDTE